MPIRFSLFALLALIATPMASEKSDSLGSACQDAAFHIAPEYHFDEDLHFFFNQKNPDFEKRYFVEWITSAEVAFFSVGRRFFFFGDMQGTINLGKWPNKAILFDPREVDIGFGPALEYRFNDVNMALGLDHHCFHEIDTIDNGPMGPAYLGPMYWNKISLNVSSKQFRPEVYRHAITGQSRLSWDQSLAWSAGIAYSLHDFFGLDTSIVSWNQPYLIDLTAEARYTVARFWGMAVILTGKTGTYFTRTNTTLWNQQLRAELLALQGAFGLDLFVNWNVVDQLPIRQNKDKLVEIGIDGFK